MYRVVRTSTLREMKSEAADLLTSTSADLTRMQAELDAAHGDVAAAKSEAAQATDAAIRAEITIESLREALTRATADAAHEEGELEALRGQHLLDTEDRAALRMLLRIVRKQSSSDRVYVLFRHGELHSAHATQESAEAAAEAEGAPRRGWTALAPGAAMPLASEVPWRVQQLPLSGVR